MDCEWRISTRDRNKIINIQFYQMDLEEDRNNCEYDYIEVRDGSTTTFPLLLPRLCGQTVPAPINSTRSVILIRFHSDSSLTSRGFKLRWKALEPTCGGLVTAPFGTITSPGYPGPYPARRTCVWRLRLLPGSTINFSFAALDIESSTNCSSDYVKLYDGALPFSSTLVGSYCGSSNALTPVQTTNPYATVKFKSNSRDSGGNTGFLLHYSSTRGCGQDFSQPDGVIDYPNVENANYEAGSNCYWSVVLPEGNLIDYEFERLDIEYSAGCNSDFVELMDGFDPDTRQQLGKYCGQPGQKVSGTTTANRLMVKFKSDSNVATVAKGFRLRFSKSCGGIFTAHTGVFTTANFPRPYTNDTTCRFTISTGKNLRILLRFGSFDLYQEDCVEIFDGPSDSSPLIRNICGRRGALELNSTHSTVLVKFSPVKGGRRGFRAYYESIGFDCGGVLTDRHGIIASPNFPNRYPSHVSCLWAVEAPSDYVVRLSFNAFSLERHRDCKYDFVSVSEDLTTDNYNGTLGRFCGNEIPPVLTSFSNIMHVKFTSDASVSDLGFSSSFITLPAHEACGGEIRQNFGIIRSPRYPSRYPSGLSCEWTIIGQPGSQIKLNITDFQIEEPSSSGNCYDYLEIRQGSLANSPLIAKICGSSLRQRIFIGFTNQIYVRFVTDRSVSGRGFQIAFDSATTGCGGTLSSPSGSIMSPNFPLPYDHLADCYWTIKGSRGSRIILSMPIMNLEDHSSCRYDFVEVRQTSSTGQFLGKFCNDTSAPARIETNSSSVWIRFRSDANTAGNGFMINYKTSCSEITLNSMHGVIQSPGYPGSYPLGSNCSWIIEAPLGNRVNLSFSMLDLYLSRNCQRDYVLVCL